MNQTERSHVIIDYTLLISKAFSFINVYCVVLMLFCVPYFVLNKVILVHYLQNTEYRHWH